MKKAVLIIIGFITLTILGTLMHEIGHIIPAKLLGYKTNLHYGSMNWENTYLDYSNHLLKKYSDIKSVPQLELDKLNELKKKEKRDSLWISIGGPLQTISTGLFGLFILYFRRNTLNRIPFGIINWLAVFLSLFWSRQIFNLLTGILKKTFGSSNSLFGGDEAEISKMLSLPSGTIGIVTGVLAIIICAGIVFKVIPKQDKVTFVSFGIIGSAIGYITWFQWLGPTMLP